MNAHVYILGNARTHLKIGHSCDLDQRIAHLRADEHDRSIALICAEEFSLDAARRIEKGIHWLLYRYVVREYMTDEWFAVHPDRALRCLARVAKAHRYVAKERATCQPFTWWHVVQKMRPELTISPALLTKQAPAQLQALALCLINQQFLAMARTSLQKPQIF